MAGTIVAGLFTGEDVLLLTITTTHHPATDLGYLLHKNPAKLQTFNLKFGEAHVFYPEATDTRCTAALLLDIDPIGLVRGRRGPAGDQFALQQYVNDRPYVASSFLSVAISQVYGSALSGTSRERPQLVDQALPLSATLSALPAGTSDEIFTRLFVPLGYEVNATPHPLDEKFPHWGPGRYWTLTLSAQITLTNLLSHLYVLVPVLDGDKHYWIGEDEVEKLLRHGEGWLAQHPERQYIVDRYLKRRRRLISQAMQVLTSDDPIAEEVESSTEIPVEKPLRLNDQRHEAVISVLRLADARRVLDLGCSTGTLLRRLLDESQFERIIGLDVSHRTLEVAADRLRLDELPPKKRQRIDLIHGSLTYRDDRLAGYDAAAVVEVIEHLEPHRLATFERVLFEHAKPRIVVLTTPNIEYNVRFETMPAGTLRHRDHRFEWTRQQFQDWSNRVATQFNYTVRFEPIGEVDAEVGAPTQMAVFERGAA